MKAPSWYALAACRGSGDHLYFGPDGERGPDARRREKKAKAICSGCPVRAQCLDWAIETRQDFGVWGGLTEDERKKERKNGRRRVRSVA